MHWEMVRHIEALGIPCFPSSETIRITGNKGLSHSLACEHGIPQPDALLTSPMYVLLQDIEYPIIMKKLESGGGNAVFRIEDRLGLARYAERLRKEERILLQQLMPTGDDMRVMTICGEIYDIMVRHPGEADFRANLQGGGESEKGTLTPDQELIVHRCLDMLPGDIETTGFMCVDFFFDEDRNILLGELNPMPGVQRLKATDPEKFSKLIEFYIGKIENYVSTL
jgi:gamma-F420-2:alpha-L-glutamate ligase